MIGLWLNGQYLLTDPDASITLRQVSPIFSREAGVSSHSYRFDIPDNSHNRRLLGFPASMLMLSLPASTVPNVQLHFRGTPIAWGTLRLHGADATSKSISVSFQSEGGAVAEMLRSIALRNLDLGGNQVLASTTGTAVYQLVQVATLPATASIWVNGFTFTTTWQIGQTAIQVCSALAGLINAQPLCEVTATGTFPDRLTLTANVGSPFNIITNPGAMRHSWVQISYSAPGSAAMSAIVAHANDQAAAAPAAAEWRFFPVFAPNWYGGSNAEWDNHVNNWDGVNQTFLANANSAGQRTRNSFVPFVQAAGLMRKAIEAAGYTSISTFIASDDFLSLYLWNNRTMDSLDPLTGVNWGNPSFNLQNHVPDMSCIDYLSGICDLFNLAQEFDPVTRQADIYPRIELLTGDLVDWRRRTLAYRVEFRPADGRAFAYEKDDSDSNFANYSGQWPDVTIGNGKLKTSSKFTPIGQQNAQNDFSGFYWDVPATGQKAASSMYGQLDVQGNVRLMLYHGDTNVEDSNAKFYPAAGNRAAMGASALGFGLPWQSFGQGIQEVFHKPFNDLRDTAREGMFTLKLSLADIMGLNWRKRYVVDTLEGPVRVGIMEYEVELSAEGISPARCKVIQL
jgi:hypothetical protein